MKQLPSWIVLGLTQAYDRSIHAGIVDKATPTHPSFDRCMLIRSSADSQTGRVHVMERRLLTPARTTSASMVASAPQATMALTLATALGLATLEVDAR